MISNNSELSSKMFKNFCELVYDTCGITLGPQKEALVSARMGKRVRMLGLPSYEAYYQLLKEGDEGELVEMLNAISTNVTYFFREEGHFDFLAERLQAWQQAGQRSFKIWCAAASTGEEPYSIAMTAHQYLDDPTQCRILATDISTRVLNVAKTGRYESRHLEKVPKAYVNRYFTKCAGGNDAPCYEVSSELKKMITYARLNLSKPPFPMKGPFDMILCRNVMIYFDNVVRTGLLNEIGRLLRPGGYLMVGHAESLSGILCDLKTVKPSIYIK
jgi:chemotaxis protein methyltransferase CheR